MQKGFSAIIFLILIALSGLLIAFSIYKLTTSKPATGKPPTQVPVTTKSIDDPNPIYMNSALGFKFTYTKGLNVRDDTEEEFNKRGLTNFRKNFTGYVQYPPADFKGAVIVLDNNNSYDKNVFSVWVFDNANNVSIDDWYEKYWYYPFVWGDFTYEGKFKFSPQKIGTISGQITKSGVIDYQSGKPKFTYLSKDGKMYLFKTVGSNGEAILNTFQFSK